MSGLMPNGQMGMVGYVIAAGVALILLPVLPLVALLWLVAEAGDEGPDAGYSG
ncbi:DUF7535 family protein [Halorussus sp. AFM4]|uniref:DUF7535 family protein n=1 Tax=Halorussus sp. AFM4 TaxID=3421651 RepID=UPI003EBDA25E